MTIDHSAQVFQDRGASRCWPLPSDSAETSLSRPAVDTGAAIEVPVAAGAGHGFRDRAEGGRPPRPAGPPAGPGPAGNPAGVPMPAFDEVRAAALACQETAARRYAQGCLASATGALTDDRSAVIELVTAG